MRNIFLCLLSCITFAWSYAQTGTINGHEYVDLGLPSGTLWATCNVGANSPKEYGNYYAWGETKAKSEYSWSTYMCIESECGTDKDPLKDYVNPNNKSIAGTQYDVAHETWGGTWMMPTLDQLRELYEYTGVDFAQEGLRLISKINRESILLPYTGTKIEASCNYDYSTILCAVSYDISHAYSFEIFEGMDDFLFINPSNRYLGSSVRPVSAKGSNDENSQSIYNLVIELQDGTKESFELADKPTISFSGSKMAINSNKVSSESYSISSIKKYYFEQNSSTDLEAPKIEDVNFSFRFIDGHAISISGANVAVVYNLNGMKIREAKGDGFLEISLDSLPSGMYIIKTNNKTIKIKK